MSIDIDQFDFGFTAVDESELEAVQKSTSKLETTSTKASELEDKLNKLYNLLNLIRYLLKSKNIHYEYTRGYTKFHISFQIKMLAHFHLQVCDHNNILISIYILCY